MPAEVPYDEGGEDEAEDDEVEARPDGAQIGACHCELCREGAGEQWFPVPGCDCNYCQDAQADGEGVAPPT